MNIGPQYALGNDEPMPGAGGFILFALSLGLGYVVIERLFGGGPRGNPEDGSRRCPLRTKIYGGLPGGGGYKAYTEYEIGAQRIAEAVHCLLGSIGNLFERSDNICPTWKHWLFYEGAHIEEEMGIIVKCLKEYSRDLYNERLIPENIERQPWKHPKYARQGLSDAQESVKDILKTSPRLIATAERNLAALDRESMPEPIWMVAERAYKFIIVLARAMEQSVSNYPGPINNAYQNDDVNYRAFLLRTAVTWLLAMQPKERA